MKTNIINNTSSFSNIDLARSVFQSAIDGLKIQQSSIDENFIKLIDCIYNLKGKVILGGMGKNSHIAKKIAATLSSTGTSSYFIHPGEASHGDLGMIARNDMVILLSKSGETTELRDIVNYTRRFHIPLTAITENSNSSLAEAADLVLTIPKINEALDFVAPTTSCTMMMVLGDAIALSLIEKRGFTREDFHIFHPGGRLGASFIKVKDLMHQGDELPIVTENMKTADVVKIMTEKNLGCAIVVDNKLNVIGIITDGDLRRKLGNNIENLLAKDLMKAGPFSIKSSSLAVEALDLMNAKAITCLIVIEDISKKLVGIIHMHDCLKSGANPFFL